MPHLNVNQPNLIEHYCVFCCDVCSGVGRLFEGGDMCEERHIYEVERQIEEEEYQEHMCNCYALMIQDEGYQEWLDKIRTDNSVYNEDLI